MADLIREVRIPYEPKMGNRWVVELLPKNNNEEVNMLLVRPSKDADRIDEWIIHSTERPTFKRTKFWKFWKRYEVDELHMTMMDPIGPSTAQKLYKILESGKRIDYDLCILDPTGVTIEKWEIRGCKILTLNFDRLDYEEKPTKLLKCLLRLQPKTAKLLF